MHHLMRTGCSTQTHLLMWSFRLGDSVAFAVGWQCGNETWICLPLHAYSKHQHIRLNWPWTWSAKMKPPVWQIYLFVCVCVYKTPWGPAATLVVHMKPWCFTLAHMLVTKKKETMLPCGGWCHVRGPHCRRYFVWALGLYWHPGKHLGYPCGEMI